MLVITRRRDQKVQIKTPQGEEITIVIKALGHGEVRLGFECSEDIRISRLDKPEYKLPQKNEEC